jgi:hypothetical protein
MMRGKREVILYESRQGNPELALASEMKLDVKGQKEQPTNILPILSHNSS